MRVKCSSVYLNGHFCICLGEWLWMYTCEQFVIATDSKEWMYDSNLGCVSSLCVCVCVCNRLTVLIFALQIYI